MAKYTFDFKMKIVQKYLDGEGGYAYLGKKYGVRSVNQIQKWVNTYKEFGEEGLFRVRQNKKYSVQCKRPIVTYLQIESTFIYTEFRHKWRWVFESKTRSDKNRTGETKGDEK